MLIHPEYLSILAARGQDCANLSPKWFGPFEIEKVMSAATVRVAFERTEVLDRGEFPLRRLWMKTDTSIMLLSRLCRREFSGGNRSSW